MSMPRIFAIHVCVVSMAMPLPYEICIRFGLESIYRIISQRWRGSFRTCVMSSYTVPYVHVFACKHLHMMSNIHSPGFINNI